MKNPHPHLLPAYRAKGQEKTTRSRRGVAALLAMLFLALLATLAVAMAEMSTMNTQTASSMADGERARGVAESGLRWATYRIAHMNRPKTSTGNISASVASSLWPSIRTAIVNDLNTLTNASERASTASGNTVTSSAIAIDDIGGNFVIKFQQHPLFVGDTMDARYIRVTSTGSYGKAVRSMYMDYTIDKKVKFAVIGKVEIQLGKNTMVEGNVAMGTPNKYPPYISLSDFKNLTSSLDTQINGFQQFLENYHKGYDGRVAVSNATEFAAATSAGYKDNNADGYIDEYDLFLKAFDSNKDKFVSAAEFTNSSTGKLYDPNLFYALDALGGPLFSGDTIRAGYQDSKIGNNDAYAKVRGQVLLADTAAGWAATLNSSGMSLYDMFAGPIIPPDPATPPVQFGVSPSQLFDLAPSNFDTTSFANKSGAAAGATSKTSTVITNATLAATDANNGTVDEKTPLGSTTFQATYRRPVFKNIKFVNCKIPKGLNALFDNCTFEGTTFVQLTTNVTTSSGSTTTNANDGKAFSESMKSGSFSTTTVLTATNSNGFVKGNNLRFNNCTIKGPIASDVPTAYTHFGNSWEFTGSTTFNNVADATATIVAPQTNIELGSYTAPTAAPSTLVGVVVVGNIDLRGTTLIDGSLIVTGDGAANTTIGWFGNNDASTDISSAPSEGWGKVNLRYNPNRVLPDGINVAVDILPNTATYTEGD